MKKVLTIVIPMAGSGASFTNAGYTFPKPLIDVNGKPMIQLIVENLKPEGIDYKFIFICQKEQYEKYSLRDIFKHLTDNKFEVIQLTSITQGAACTVLTAVDYI